MPETNKRARVGAVRRIAACCKALVGVAVPVNNATGGHSPLMVIITTPMVLGSAKMLGEGWGGGGGGLKGGGGEQQWVHLPIVAYSRFV